MTVVLYRKKIIHLVFTNIGIFGFQARVATFAAPNKLGRPRVASLGLETLTQSTS